MRRLVVSLLLAAVGTRAETSARSPTYASSTSRLTTAKRENTFAVVTKPKWNGTLTALPRKVGQVVTRSLTVWSTTFLDFLKQHLLLLLPGRGRLVVRPEDQVPGGGGNNEDEKPPKFKPRVLRLNVMVAGLSGLGKTTACNELLASWRRDEGPPPSPNVAVRRERRYGGDRISSHNHIPSEEPLRTSYVPSLGRGLTKETTQIDESRVMERRWSDVVARVKIIDTPSLSHNDIFRYLKKCQTKQFQNPDDEDHIVHCLLYFIGPHRLTDSDKVFLEKIAKKDFCPIIPIIAKSDTLTNSELQEYRHVLNQELKGFDCYSFDSSTPSPYVPLPRNRLKGDCLALITRDGFYPWGASRVHNPDHSDFNILRKALLSEHTERLVDLGRAKYQKFHSRLKVRSKVISIAKSFGLFLSCFLLFRVTHPFKSPPPPPPVKPKRFPSLLRPLKKLRFPSSSSSSDSDSSSSSPDTKPLKNLLTTLTTPPDLSDQRKAQQILAVLGGILGVYLIAPSPF